MNSRKLIKSIVVLFVLAVASELHLHATVFTNRTQIPSPARRLNQTGEYAVGIAPGCVRRSLAVCGTGWRDAGDYPRPWQQRNQHWLKQMFRIFFPI
ncbi:MAG: hypothetical protein LBE71_05765 [Dysgonamonadaceae bacterium]|nr:hypothetical protein [Dysgonamonadaceae bacterium]